ncbi:ankyrin repeat-containing domain protein [Aspergillus varians]
MAFSTLPAELIHDIVIHTAPHNWGDKWVLNRDHVRWFLDLRRVCKEFDKVVLDFFLTKKSLGEYFTHTSLWKTPATAVGMAMGRRLLSRRVERDRAQEKGTDSALIREIINVVDAAVELLSGENADATQPQLRELYTRGLTSAVIGFSRVEGPLLKIAGEGLVRLQSAAPNPDRKYLLTKALTAAAILGRVDDMKVLISQGADIKFDRQDGWLGPPLLAAAMGGHMEAIKLLVNDIEDAKIRSAMSGDTALHCAALNGHEDVVDFLLELGVQPGPKNTHEETPLFCAVGGGHAGIVAKLLKYDSNKSAEAAEEPKPSPLDLLEDLEIADDEYDDYDELKEFNDFDDIDLNFVDVNAEDGSGRTPLVLAVERGHLEVVKQLMGRKDLEINVPHPGLFNTTPLGVAAARGHEDIFQQLLLHPDIDNKALDNSGHTILKHAAVGMNESIVKATLQWLHVYGNLGSVDASTPLMWASTIPGNDAVVKILLNKPGVNVNHQANQFHVQLRRALSSEVPDGAIDASDRQILRALTGELAVLAGASALDAAAQAGCDSILQLLLAHPDIVADEPDMDGRTPLMNAASCGSLGAVKILLARDDVDADRRDDLKRTTFILAAKGGHINVVKYFLENAEQVVNLADEVGFTGLAHAAKEGHIEVVKMLLEHPNISVEWALAGAASEAHEDIIRLLLENKAVTSRRVEVERALDTATECAQDEMQAFFSEYLQTMPQE